MNAHADNLIDNSVTENLSDVVRTDEKLIEVVHLTKKFGDLSDG